MATNLENMENLENSGSLKNCQNLRENGGKFEFLQKNPGKLRENVEYVAESAKKMYSSELFSSELLREKFENDLEISYKTQGIWSLKNVATL